MAKAMCRRLERDVILKMHRLCDTSDAQCAAKRAAILFSGEDKIVDEWQWGVFVMIGHKYIECPNLLLGWQEFMDGIPK